MNANDYAALVAMDWGDTEHAFALHTADGANELGTISATPEALHDRLEHLGRAQRVMS